MKDLLTFLIEKITGSQDFKIEAKEEGNQINFEVKANPNIIGLIIGKEGRTIKSLRKILSVPAVRQDKLVYISVLETEGVSSS